MKYNIKTHKREKNEDELEYKFKLTKHFFF